jgi:hypothetical protein
MSSIDDNDILTARSTALVLLTLTALLSFCWILVDDSRIQAAAFVSGTIAVVTWLSYCQRKTTAEVQALMLKNKSTR